MAPPDNDRPGSGSSGTPGQGSSGAQGSSGGFGWLYGKDGAAEPPPPAPRGRPQPDQPEATRVMPVQPRPDGAPPPRTAPRGSSVTPGRPSPAPAPGGAAGSGGTPPPPPPPGGGGSGGSGGSGVGGWFARRLRRPRFYVRTVLLVLLLWVVYTVAVPFVTWSTSEQVAFEPDGDRPAEQDGTTYLLVGNDSRAGLTAEQRKQLSTGNPDVNLTDTIMLLHTGSGPNVLLSVPRDTEVDMPGYGTSKINSAYARGGAPLLVEVLENETGIRIDEYVQIGLGGVADVVDAVGGIEVCPVERIKDKAAGLNIKKGCQTVDGTTALAYSRSRKQSALGDLERVRRQREVVSAVGTAVLSPWTVINPVRWYRLNKAVPTFFTFGEGMSSVGAAKWALAMTRVDGTQGLTCTVPVTDGSATTWDRDRADPLFGAIADDDTDRITDDQCTPNGVRP